MEKEKFQLIRVKGQPVEDSELIFDLKKVASKLETNTLPQRKYGELGKYDITTVIGKRKGPERGQLRKERGKGSSLLLT